MFREKVLARKAGILTYGLTPPKLENPPEKIAEIAHRQAERLRDVPIDGLIVYDIQDEGDRAEKERPFPFLQTVDPSVYSEEYLGEIAAPKIIYRCVGKYEPTELEGWIAAQNGPDPSTVFVGASSAGQQVKLSLKDAYGIYARSESKLLLGGVLIPERHLSSTDEHLRVIGKIGNGCRFFVSQAIYNIEASKNFLSDYYYTCLRQEIPMVPILFNFTPCGSEKTLQFMKWLGISFPRWLENDLVGTNDILEKSMRLTKEIFTELFEYGLEKGIPIGCSIESVSTRKVEIEASVQLAREMAEIMARRLGR